MPVLQVDKEAIALTSSRGVVQERSQARIVVPDTYPRHLIVQEFRVLWKAKVGLSAASCGETMFGSISFRV
jgi:hypothetical protein